jgi:hypothetical protein
VQATDRKATAKGRIETIDEKLLCEGDGIFVKPRKEILKQIMAK